MQFNQINGNAKSLFSNLIKVMETGKWSVNKLLDCAMQYLLQAIFRQEIGYKV